MKLFEKYSWINILALCSLGLIFFCLPNSLALHNSGFALGVLISIFGGYFYHHWNTLKKEPLTWVILVLFLLVCLAATHSLSSWDAALGVTFNKYSKIILALFILALFLDGKNRTLCYKAFFIGSIVVLITTYLNVWFDIPWSVTKNTGWGVDHTVFGNYITQSLMMSFFVLMCFHYARNTLNIKFKVVLFCLSLLAIGSVFYLSNGRTGYLAILVGVFFYVLFSLPKKWSWIGASLIGVFALIAFQTSDRVQERYELAQKETQLLFEEAERGEVPTFSSIGARWYMWMKTLENIQERPLTGWGLGSHGIKWCEKAPQPVWCSVGDTTPHNQFLFFTVELGVLGFIAFSVLFLVLIWAGLGSPKYRPLMMGFVGIFLVDSLVNASLWNSREYNFFLMMMVLLYASARFEKNENASRQAA